MIKTACPYETKTTGYINSQIKGYIKNHEKSNKKAIKSAKTLAKMWIKELA